MPRSGRPISESGVYHAVTRGVNKRTIFTDDADYRRYLALATEAADRFGMSVLVYALMPNHVHLLLGDKDSQISAFFQRLNSCYAKWFNWRHDRVGHLFQGRFKAFPVNDDAYLAAVIRYIHRNPVKAGLAHAAGDYPWSSRPQLDGRPGSADIARLAQLLPLERIVAFEAQNDNADDAVEQALTGNRRGPHPLVSNHQAATVLAELVSAYGRATFADLPSRTQVVVVREMAARGLAVRRLPALTGWGMKRINRALRDPALGPGADGA
ncbi:MAG: transposase [Bifidobacteriaceae bacterium]|jgi:REP element-mobilizing transposase RayT|nr:transposase [Bifidobacteriaceae bacterium]